MQIYSKSVKIATSLSFLGWFWFCLIYCPRLTKLVRGLWNRLCTCVCACVRASTKNATSLFLGRFWFCLFYLIGLGGGFKTSTYRILKFITYANYSKSIKNATSPLFLGRFWFCLFYLIGLGGGFKTSTYRILNFINYANLFKINKKCYFSPISWPILILFVLSDRAWGGLQNFYTEFWNSLIICKFMEILSKSMKIATSLSFLGQVWFCLIYCPRLTKLVRGLWNGLHTCVCPCVRVSVRPCINTKGYFSSISWPILILFVLSDRAWCGL